MTAGFALQQADRVLTCLKRVCSMLAGAALRLVDGKRRESGAFSPEIHAVCQAYALLGRWPEAENSLGQDGWPTVQKLDSHGWG